MNNKARIAKMRRNLDGDITDVMLENGNVYSIDEAVTMAEDGLLEGVDVSQLRSGRAAPDTGGHFIRQNNLDELDILD